MRVFTAENSGGDIIVIHSAPGFTRDSFTTYVLSAMRELDGDDPNAQHLDLYEWEPDDFAKWYSGDSCIPFIGWDRMAENACYGRIEYCWPGQLTFLRPNEKAPQPSIEWMAENTPISMRLANGYARNDPKSAGYHDRMSELMG